MSNTKDVAIRGKASLGLLLIREKFVVFDKVNHSEYHTPACR